MNTSTAPTDAIAALVVLAFLVFAYFLPAVIAGSRGHHNAVAIFMVNLLLGWTFLGWVAALVWAVTAVNPSLKRS